MIVFLFGFTPRLILRGLPLRLARMAPDIQLKSFSIERQRLSFDGQLILSHPRLVLDDGRSEHSFSAAKLVVPNIWQALSRGRDYHMIAMDLRWTSPVFTLRAPESRHYLDLSRNKPQWQGLFRDAELEWGGLTMTQVSGQFRHSKGSLSLHDLMGRLWGAQAHARFEVDQFQPLHVSLTASLNGLHPAEIQGIPGLLSRVDGPVTAEIRFKGSRNKVELLSLRFDLPARAALSREFLEQWIRQTGQAAKKPAIVSLVSQQDSLTTDQADFVLFDAADGQPFLSMEIISQPEQIFINESFPLIRMEDSRGGFPYHQYQLKKDDSLDTNQ